MKRFIIIFAAVILAASTMSAQTVSKKYKEIKDIYNPKEYVKSANDPYNRGLAGLGSFFVPGLGQVLAGETGRGIRVFCGDALLGLAGGVCAYKALDYVERDAAGNFKKDADGDLVVTDQKAFMKWGLSMLGFGCASLVYDIWNICDAVKVAKVKNMYYQDIQSRAMELKFYPSVDYAMTSNGNQAVAGMTVALRF